jgi:hypothetical protein
MSGDLCVMQTLFSVHPLLVQFGTHNSCEMISKFKSCPFGAIRNNLVVLRVKILVLVPPHWPAVKVIIKGGTVHPASDVTPNKSL